MDVFALSLIHPWQDQEAAKCRPRAVTLVSFSYLFLVVQKTIILFYFIFKKHDRLFPKTETGATIQYKNITNLCFSLLLFSLKLRSHPKLSFSLRLASIFLRESEPQKRKKGAEEEDGAASRGRSPAKATTTAASWRLWADHHWNHQDCSVLVLCF